MKLYTKPCEYCDIDTARGRKNLKADMLGALEYPEIYGLKKYASKGSKCYEITVTIKRVSAKKKAKP